MHVLLARYSAGVVFGILLQKDVREFALDWNSHLIRKNRLTKSPRGRPSDLYSMPILQGTINNSCCYMRDLAG